MNTQFYLYDVEVVVIRSDEVKIVTFTCNAEELLDWVLRVKYNRFTILRKYKV